MQVVGPAVMERDLSAYRFVGGRITEITEKSEIDEIEGGLVAARSAGGAATHLEASLARLADRSSPDRQGSQGWNQPLAQGLRMGARRKGRVTNGERERYLLPAQALLH